MRRTLVILLGIVALGASACGGGGSGRYEESGLNMTFKIPGGFHVAHDISVSRSAGASPVDRAAVGIDKDNLIIVQRYDLKVTITATNLSKYKGEVDNVIATLAGAKVSGHEVTYGNLPGYEYVISVTEPPKGESRLAVLFDGATEYLVNCHSTPDKRDKVEKACCTVLDSIKHV